MNTHRIAWVSSELAPFAKTGGLADVSAALPRALARAGHDLRVFLPLYPRVRGAGSAIEPHPVVREVPMRMGSRHYTFDLATTRLPESGVEVGLVDCPALYQREELYTNDEDEPLRFAMLCRAAIESCQWLQWAPDVFHCNDWHAGLLPLYLKTLYAWDAALEGCATVLTIHNIGYQGVFPSRCLGDLELGESRGLLYQEDLAQDRVNFLKTGVLYADRLTTVSRTYAAEIQTAEHGHGLEELLRSRAGDLHGIVNGVDYGEWDPAVDPHLPVDYAPGDLTGKELCKEALCEEVDLHYDPHAPLVGIVSRLAWQKGFELLPEVLPRLLRERDLRLIVLGSGEEKYEQFFSWLQREFPGKAAFRRGYDNPLAHRIEAGSDLFLMPSRYEPCGLNQMYSLKYGTVPVVRRTGGLADTVEPFDRARGTGTGFLFDEFRPEALDQALRAALQAWRDPGSRLRLVENGMRQDFSWERQAREYEELYAALAARAPA